MDPVLVIPLHPVHRCEHPVIDSLPVLLRVDELTLVKAVQGFRGSIIIRIALAAHRPDGPLPGKPLRITDRRVLDTPVGMMDQAAEILIPPRPYRHLQRIERQIRTQVVRDLPSENTAGEQIPPTSAVKPPGK